MRQLKPILARDRVEPKREQLYVDISNFPELAQLVEERAKRDRVSKASVVRDALQEYFCDVDPNATSFMVKFRPGREAFMAQYVRKAAERDQRTPGDWIAAVLERAATDAGL